MITEKRYQYLQRMLFIGFMLLMAYILIVYKPLNNWIESLDLPIQKRLNELSGKNPIKLNNNTIDITPIERRLNILEDTQQKFSAIEKLVKKQTALSQFTTEKIKQPFQLVDFQNERQLRQEELEKVANTSNVIVYPSVLSGYPEYSAELKRPELLWAQLEMVHSVLLAAINSRVYSINSLSITKPQKTAPSEGKLLDMPDEILFRVQITSTSRSLFKFLADVTGGFTSTATSNTNTTKISPPMLIDRILIKKEGPENPELIRAEIRFCGFVFFEKENL